MFDIQYKESDLVYHENTNYYTKKVKRKKIANCGYCGEIINISEYALIVYYKTHEEVQHLSDDKFEKFIYVRMVGIIHENCIKEYLESQKDYKK
jgi:hypothetical protein